MLADFIFLLTYHFSFGLSTWMVVHESGFQMEVGMHKRWRVFVVCRLHLEILN